MDIDKQVDLLLNRKNGKGSKKNHKQFWLDLGLYIVAFMLGSMTVLVAYEHRKEIATLFSGGDTKEVVDVGEEVPPEPEAYHYWYAPENSFGVSSTKTVNWSYFKSLFLAHTDWMLEYKRYEYSDWTDGSQYMTIERTWNDSGFWKFNLIFDVPVHVYSARFTFGIDLQCLQYVERDGYEVWINYSANATETYSCMFNWSDIASIPGIVITHGKTDDMFWFRFRRDDIPAGHYEFDPIFGEQGTGSFGYYLDDGGTEYIQGQEATPDSSGTADNITARVKVNVNSHYVKCALYVKSTLAFVDETEAKVITDTSYTWHQFDFSSPPSITGGTAYYIVAYGGHIDGTNAYINRLTGTGSVYRIENNYPTFPNPLTIDNTGSSNISIYCSYTEGAPANNAPTQTGESPSNQSTGIDVSGGVPDLYVICNDADAGDTMNATWRSNSSGAWVTFATNSSISPTTNITQSNANFSTESTTYWWSVNLSDGTDYTNATYHFTTAANETRTPTQVFNYWFLCGNETTRTPTEIFNYYFECGNTSYREPTEVFNYYFNCGNTSARQPTEVFNYYFQCGNGSARASTEVFNYWFACGNGTARASTEIFDYYFQCGNGTVRTPTSIFDYYFNCGNTSIRSPTKVFDYWFQCENVSGVRTPTQVFDYYFNCGNETQRQPTEVFNYWFYCENTSERQPTNVFNYYFNCGNTSYREPTQVFNYYFNCGNTSARSPTQIFDYWFDCGNVSEVRTPTEVFNYYFICGNETARQSTEVFNYWFQCGNESQRTPTQIFNYWFYCENTTPPPVFNITITNEYPSNGSTNIQINTSLHFTVNNTLGYIMNVTVYTGSNLTNCSAYLGSFNSVNNGTYYMGYHNASEVSTEYSWRVNVTDAYGNYAEEIYNFTTASITGMIYAVGGIGGYNTATLMSFMLMFGVLFLAVGLIRRRRRRYKRGY